MPYCLLYSSTTVQLYPNPNKVCAPESSVGIPILPLSVPQELQVNLARVVV